MFSGINRLVNIIVLNNVTLVALCIVQITTIPRVEVVYLLVFPPPPAIINSEFIRPDEPRLPKLDADMDGNPPAFPWPAHLLF